MAERYIYGKLYKAEKVTLGICTKCDRQFGSGWRVSKVMPGILPNQTVALYCYDCSGNHWSTSFRLYREERG